MLLINISTVWLSAYMSNTYARCPMEKSKGHFNSICQMDQMDLQLSIGLLRVHWIQWTNGMSIGQQWINRNYASTE
jgi:hypothetical protein